MKTTDFFPRVAILVALLMLLGLLCHRVAMTSKEVSQNQF